MATKKTEIIPRSNDPEIIALEKLIEEKLSKHGISSAFVRVIKKRGEHFEYSVYGASSDVAKAKALLESKHPKDL